MSQLTLMQLYFTVKKMGDCVSSIGDRFYTHAQLVEGDQEALDGCLVNPFVLLLALKSCIPLNVPFASVKWVL